MSRTVWSQWWTVTVKCQAPCGHNGGLSRSSVTHSVVTMVDCHGQVSSTVCSQSWTVTVKCHAPCVHNLGLSRSSVMQHVATMVHCHGQAPTDSQAVTLYTRPQFVINLPYLPNNSSSSVSVQQYGRLRANSRPDYKQHIPTK